MIRPFPLRLPKIPQFALLVVCLALASGLAILGVVAWLGVGTATEASQTNQKIADEAKNYAVFCLQQQGRYDDAVYAVKEKESFENAEEAWVSSRLYLGALTGRRESVPGAPDEEESRAARSLEEYARLTAKLASTKKEKLVSYLILRQTFGERVAKSTFPGVVPPPRPHVDPIQGLQIGFGDKPIPVPGLSGSAP